MQPNLADMSLTELKAFAYDILAQTQNLQQHLQVVNQEIEKKSKEAQSTLPEAPAVESVEPEVV